MKVLIVEDNTNDRKLLRCNLERHGCETVIEARDGQEGLEMAMVHKPDLIISDALMPKMDGFQFLHKVKMDAGLKSIPFLIYSSVYTGYKEEELALSLGAEAFIAKPKEPGELWEIVAATMGEHTAWKESVPDTELMDGEKDFVKKYYEIVSTKLEEKVRELEEALVLLKETEEALTKTNEELEIRVAERTEELVKKHVELESQNMKLLKTYHELEMETAERIRAMEELRIKDQMLIQQSRMAAMGEMLGNIAHQWRQPLNVLGLTLQQLGLCCEAGKLSKELLDNSIDKAMGIIFHLSQTINDFRNFSAQDKEKSLFKVNQVIAKTISLVEESFREQHIVIDVSAAGEPEINGYPNEFCQVILNILMNARDALLERGANEARVTLRSWAEDGRVMVTIVDNAGGIPEDIIARIFDAYFTTKELGKGTGIGLFMSKTIIEKNMGGRLTASNLERGAEFRIEV